MTHALLLLLRADLAALAGMDQPIERYFASLDRPEFDEFTIYNVKLALQELCTNIIKHAYAEDRGSIFVCIRAAEDSSWIELTTRDSGKHHWHATDWTAPTLDEPQEHGMGIWLIQALMDEVDYLTADDESHRWRLRKYVTVPATECPSPPV